jgi:thioredoxin 1
MATIDLTKDNFEATVLQEGEIVLLDFWASWCGPCKMFGPIFEAASEKHPDIVFGKVNTEEQPELGGMFQVRSIPTIMVFRDGLAVFQQAGALPAEMLEDLVTQVRALDMAEVKAKIAAHVAEQGDGEQG